MDATDLPEQLKLHRDRLTSNDANPADIAKGLALILLALEQLLRSGPRESPADSQDR